MEYLWLVFCFAYRRCGCVSCVSVSDFVSVKSNFIIYQDQNAGHLCKSWQMSHFHQEEKKSQNFDYQNYTTRNQGAKLRLFKNIVRKSSFLQINLHHLLSSHHVYVCVCVFFSLYFHTKLKAIKEHMSKKKI